MTNAATSVDNGVNFGCLLRARDALADASARTGTEQALGADHPGVEAGQVQAAGEAGVLDLHTTVHDDRQPGRWATAAASSLHSPSWAQKV